MGFRGKKYQPRRTDLLVNTEWGIPVDSLSEDEARKDGLVLFKERWVSRWERDVLRSQIRWYRLIRLSAFITILCGLTLIAVSVPPGSHAPDPMGLITVAAGVAAVAALVIAMGLWWFRAWARRAGAAINSLAAICTLAMIYLTITDPFSTPALLCFELILLVIWVTGLIILLNSRARHILGSIDHRSASSDRLQS